MMVSSTIPVRPGYPYTARDFVHLVVQKPTRKSSWVIVARWWR